MASRKRKKSSPNRLSYENQQGLTWSLKDMFIKQDGILNGLHENDRQGFSESSATTSHKFCKRAKHTTTQPRDLFIKTSLPKSWHCILGTFDLDLIDSQNLRKIDQTCCRVTIDLDQFLSNELNSSEENKDDILPDNLRGLSMEGQTVLSHDLIDAIIFLQKKDILFLVLPTNTSILDNIWSVKVCLHESALTNLQFPSQDTTIRKTDKMLKLVMEHFFESAINQDGDSIDDDEQEIMSRFDDLYKSIMEKKMTFHKNLSDNTGDMSTSGSPLYCQHSDLKPTLRRYQKQAVLWMLSREKDKKIQSDIKGLHILWRKYITLDKKILFYNPYNGRMTTKQFPPPPEPCGGILADEMGLGKTVEVIACILNNPKPCETTEQLTNTLEQTHVKQPTTCITSQPMDTINMEQLPVTNTIEEPHLKQPTTCTTSQPMDTINMKQLPVTCECICGMVQAGVYVVQCTKCFIVLHSKCVGGFKNNFLCPRCSVNRPPIPSSATLIISPETIVHQWVEEIKRHVSEGALKVMVYEGVNKKGFITPEEICDNDVILTTYSTLRAEFHHLNKEQGRNMRYQKRYMALPSPLTAINFWRICLDEAQMVETTTAKAAEMALQLHCVHRWCVTGTPIQKGLEDLYGLLLFLGLYPYCQKVWWKKLLCDPYMRGYKEPMQNALSGIFWRTAKNDVLDEIHLPSQTEHLVRLKFSPVEEHFYQRQHEECSSWAVRMLSKFDQVNAKLNSLDRHTVHMMLTPLLRLRQACCHPQAVRGGFLSIHKSTLTMDELLENLTAKAKLECEEAHRQLLFAINGLAGIHIIKEEFTIAVDLYRQSMHSWVEHEKYFRTDKLQKLHTLHNLNELLSYGSPGCSQTTADEKLADKIKDYTSEYMLKPNAQVEMAISNLDNAKKHTQELENKAEKNSPWWILAIGCVQSQRLEVELISRVKDQLSSMESSLILDSFTDLSGLQFVLTAKIDKIKSTRKDLLDVLDYLCCYPTSTMVHVTAACCLRSKEPTDDNQSNRCKFCQADGIFTDYESKLFGHQGMKGTDGQNEIAATDAHSTRNTGGLRAETDTDKVLKTVYSFIKYHGLSPDLHQSAIDHSSYMEALRKEFKILRAGWFSLRERISSMDELEMCTTRLRLANSYESVDDLETHVIPPCEVNQQRLKFSSDRFVAQSTLRKRLGQYMYLTNLSKKSSQGENPDTCPVCTKQLGKQWSVFSCGHSYCCQCVWALLHHVGTRSGQVKCPVCRALTNTAEVSYVSTNGQVSETNSVSVKGSHSTKVEAIVRTLLVIIAEDSTAKCLVFSTWQDVLELIARALLENHVSFRHVSCTKRLQANLDDFKTDSCVNVLLLPLQSGSNGLNIIEATHVLLVEPALNPAHELQAIGRVHRIGQTRPTHVHRFIIDYTVESRLHSLFHGKSSNAARKGNKDTENSLTIADLATLFNGSHSL